MNTTPLTVSAPGKLLLFGDHAVVYGHPSLTTAIDERMFVTISQTGDGHIVIDAPQVHDTRFVDMAAQTAVNEWGITHHGFRLTTNSMFTGKYGFGSSSAVTVATLQAIASLYHKDVELQTIFEKAYSIVLSIQGVGSGFDVAAAAYGGTLYYVKGAKQLKALKITDTPLVAGYTGVKSNTVDMVNMIADKRKKYPEKVERIFGAIGNIVDEAKTRMTEGDWERVGRLMDFNQEYLRDLGVSSEKLEALIAAAKSAGAWGAKLSGAGGGDCMIALVSADKRQAVEDAITHAGGEVVHVTPGAPGVRIETTDNQEELFIVVDKDDNVLGYKTRFECHHNPSFIHRTVGALIFNDKGQLLLQKRSMTKDMEAGLWCVSASGHVVKGQTDDEAAHRELQEELGIDVPLAFFKKFITKNIEETERAALYKGKSNGPFTPDMCEVSDVRFFDPREIKLLAASKKLVFTDAAVRSLTEAGIL